MTDSCDRIGRTVLYVPVSSPPVLTASARCKGARQFVRLAFGRP
jgi:hypothetical protein